MKLIIGLGNPGKEYEHTRHNAGFLALDLLADELGVSWKNDTSHHADVAKATIEGTSVLLAKPTTFMNRSGDAAQSLTSYYKVGIGDILVIQDEMDLAPGTIAFKQGGGTAGHNGIASVTERLGTSDIARLRVGVGRPVGPIAPEDWVLGKTEGPTHDAIKKTPDAIKDWISHGLAKAMNTWNQKVA